MDNVNLMLTRLYVAVTLPRPRDERGDVPGWVMITVMTAGIVGALTLIAGPRLSEMLNAALDRVSGK
jgi:hypothetical protein